jgi:RNA polymerase sigma-70 factor, ECF subfamily
MDDQAVLVEGFDRVRGHLRAVAYRMLGSTDEADDAVQEAWLRAARAGVDQVENLTGWLTTIVGRVCLDMLRVRKRSSEDVTDVAELDLLPGTAAGRPALALDPQDEAAMADEVGLALLVVLDALGPAERVAFVLHDLFSVPFDEIAGIVERTPATAKKLASRARLRVRGAPVPHSADLLRHRKVVAAFLAASRAGRIDELLDLLAPDVVRHVDAIALPPGVPTDIRGAHEVAEGAVFTGARAGSSRPVVVDGSVGAVVAPAGRLIGLVLFEIAGDRITGIDIVADPGRLRDMRVTLPARF